MLFYRVCHRTLETHRKKLNFHSGPYQYNYENIPSEIEGMLAEMSNTHSQSLNTPSVPFDFGFRLPFAGNFVCGFSSPDRLQKWFDGYFELLYEAGFIVRVWDVPSNCIEQGKRQDCALIDFIANTAPVKEMDMAEFESSYGKELQHV